MAWVHVLHDRRTQGDRYWDQCRELGMEGKSLAMFRWVTPEGEVVPARYVARELWDSEAEAIVKEFLEKGPTP